MFSSEQANAISENDIQYLEAGIVEDVELSGAEFKSSPSGNKYIEITFKKDGAAVTSTEWEPKPFGDQTDADFAKSQALFVKRLLKILECFYDKTLLNVKADTFEELANWFVKLITVADKSKLVRVKLTYNKSGYVVLAPGAYYTVIEPMTIAKGDSKIRILSKDVIMRPKKDTDDIKDIKDTKSDDLPF